MVLQTIATLQLRRAHIADEERFELSTIDLTSASGGLPLSYPSLLARPDSYRETPPGVKDRYSAN